MKYARILLGVTALIVILCLATISMSQTANYICGSTCATDHSICNGAVLIDGDGRPIGCSRDWIAWPPAVNCDGSCYRCTANASVDVCLDAEDDDCWIPTPVMPGNCGYRRQFACGGVWSALCTCPNIGGTMTTTDCDPIECIISGLGG
jgi:hypothetical protein